MGKRKQNETPGNDAGPMESSAVEPVEAPETIEADGPVLEEEPEALDSVEDSIEPEVDVSSGESDDGDMLLETADITEQMTQLERETHELKETLLRKMAEFENL
ncbi:MAG: hypothetical protein KAH24_04235, partial [Holophagae bacterium]|nr:hypothetical protein [Holophagae bacterium]